ncbi:hypothetical protein A2482_04120 [Candidatus Falkowbacteria bacterium RIFOXYC2_FULL_48_21]|uniref:Uncharacterized protein n=1 Tax=Candidatus Falkowbacteria bacterium RIFOXYC2_FULL_48_21 TaxID=1798005 RepID=A0A1F5TBV9_9BACT|nr:MAG: hypothetical protein A2482_04120 [Candidatus Falkowbacteria bacterium RIFOXYC2_FULL_48_21]
MGTKQLRSAYKLGKGQYEKAALEFDGAILKQGGDAYDIYERFLDETPEGKEFLRASARGLVLGESVVAFEKAIEAAGGDPRVVFEGLRTDTEYTAGLAQYLVTLAKHNAGPVVPASAKKVITAAEARQIMGRNIFDAADWASYYNVQFTKRQLREAAKFPWGEDVLNGPCPYNQGKLVKETHFAFLGITKINGVPFTVEEWLKLHPSIGDNQPRFCFAENPWHAGQPHTDVATMEFRWYLLLKEIVPGSTSKFPDEQVAMLASAYEVPSTIAEVSKEILVFRKTNVRPNQTLWSACKERTVKTDQVAAGLVSCVDRFRARGLRVSHWDGARDGRVGVGASRKF